MVGQYKGPSGDYLTIYVEKSEVVFECKPHTSSAIELRAQIAYAQRHLIRFEFASSQTEHFMSLSVDNREQELTMRSRHLDYHPGLAEFTIGADVEGMQGADFLLLSHMFINRILSIEEKFGLFRFESDRHPVAGLHFKRSQFMRRDPSGNLIQDIDANRPWYQSMETVLREWA